MQQNILTVGLGDRAYDIVIGPDLIDRAGEALGPIVLTATSLSSATKTLPNFTSPDLKPASNPLHANLTIL